MLEILVKIEKSFAESKICQSIVKRVERISIFVKVVIYALLFSKTKKLVPLFFRLPLIIFNMCNRVKGMNSTLKTESLMMKESQ